MSGHEPGVFAKIPGKIIEDSRADALDFKFGEHGRTPSRTALAALVGVKPSPEPNMKSKNHLILRFHRCLVHCGRLIIAVSIGASPLFAQASSAEPLLSRARWQDGALKWTTSDSIAMRIFSNSDNGSILDVRRYKVLPSPDGRYIVVQSTRSDEKESMLIQAVDIYEVRQLQEWLHRQGVSPMPVFRHFERSHSRVEPIYGISWDPGSEALSFNGRDGDSRLQRFRFDLLTSRVTQLTHATMTLQSQSAQGSTVLYLAGDWFPEDPANAPTIVPAPRDINGDIKMMLHAKWTGPIKTEFVAEFGGTEKWVIPFSIVSFAAWFSPDSTHAVVTPFNREGEKPGESIGSILEKPQRFVLLDLSRREVKPLSAVPVSGRLPLKIPLLATAAQPYWSPDGSQLALMNTALPDGTKAPDGSGSDEAFVGIYAVQSGHWQILEPLHVAGRPSVHRVGWLKQGKEFLVTHELNGKPAAGTLYVLNGARWVGYSVDSDMQPPAESNEPASLRRYNTLPPGLTIRVRQTANDPPVLVVADNTQEKILSQPDPALANIGICRQEPFSWTEANGHKVTGGLILPRDAQPGERFPLVIDLKGYFPDFFLPDGPVPTGHAPQAMAAQGMAVLQMDYEEISDRANVREGPDLVARVDAAVEALAQKGQIDPTRVGLIGHSHAGIDTYYIVTHPGKTHLAAAEIWDAKQVSFPEYLQDSATLGFPSDEENLFGGFFWQNKQSWLKHEFMFNADRVEAATLFVDCGMPARAVDEVNLTAVMSIGAFQLNRKPFDYLFIPNAGHIIPAPRPRKAAMDVSVDWMNFWLQGKEDPSLTKVEQYQRWRLIRKKHDQHKRDEAEKATIGTPAEQKKHALAEMKSAGVSDPGHDPNVLNIAGYKAMYERNDPRSAITYFRWNLALFPEAAGQLEDSLAEGYLQSGDGGNAARHYRKAMELEPKGPKYRNLRASLLDRDPYSLMSLQEEARQLYFDEQRMHNDDK